MHYGSDPLVYAQIWEDLHTTNNPEAHISEKATADSFLQRMHFVKLYPKKSERAGTSKECQKTAPRWVWYFIPKVQALKGENVTLQRTTLVELRASGVDY
jgi:hypothetical protein